MTAIDSPASENRVNTRNKMEKNTYPKIDDDLLNQLLRDYTVVDEKLENIEILEKAIDFNTKDLDTKKYLKKNPPKHLKKKGISWKYYLVGIITTASIIIFYLLSRI